jgi:hypothetical protein
MLEAMYDDNVGELANTIGKYDECAYQGLLENDNIWSQINVEPTDGSTECDRLAKVYKCGTENVPDLVSNMIQKANLATPVVRKSYLPYIYY